MFNKTKQMSAYIVSFFHGKASYSDEKIVCMVEYIQLTTVFRSQSDKERCSCIVFLYIFLVILVLPCSPAHQEEEEEEEAPV